MKSKDCIFILAIIASSASVMAQCVNPRTFTNKLEVSFNFESSHLYISGLACDICVYGEEGSDICSCRSNCKLDADEKNELEACIEDCERRYSDPVYFNYCLDLCEEYEASIIDECLKDCGTLPEKERMVVEYQIYTSIWYNTGPTETFAGQPKVAKSSPTFSGQPTNIVVVDLDHQFPDDPISYCFAVRTSLRYDDGTCCFFWDYGCFNLG